MLVLSKKIIQSYPDGFQSFMVIGRRGIGKSSYSLRALHDALVDMGYDDETSWNMSLDSIKFKISDVCSYLLNAVNSDDKKIALVWDDLRVFASGSQYQLQMKLVNKLIGLLDTVRTAVSILILTCPSPKGLLSVLQSYDDYLIKIRHCERGGYYREATGYLWTTLPSGQRRIYTKFRDSYNCRLPNWVYDEYMVQRKQALRDALVGIDQLINE